MGWAEFYCAAGEELFLESPEAGVEDGGGWVELAGDDHRVWLPVDGGADKEGLGWGLLMREQGRSLCSSGAGADREVGVLEDVPHIGDLGFEVEGVVLDVAPSIDPDVAVPEPAGDLDGVPVHGRQCL